MKELGYGDRVSITLGDAKLRGFEGNYVEHDHDGVTIQNVKQQMPDGIGHVAFKGEMFIPWASIASLLYYPIGSS